MRSLAAGLKCRRTYSRPLASPASPSTRPMPRRQRSRSCGVPDRVRPKKSKSSSTKADDRYGARADSTCQRAHACHVSSGTCATAADSASRKLGIPTIAGSSADSGAPSPRRHASHGTCGASSSSSARVTFVYVVTASRVATRSQWAPARRDSKAMICAASAAGSGRIAKASIRSMCATYAARTSAYCSSR